MITTIEEALPSTMKAVTQYEYGLVEKLRIEHLPTPRPGENEVLVRMHSAAICKGDVHLMTGKPYVTRLMFGLRRPKHVVIGQELSGTVVCVGPGVHDLRVGDAVFGQVGRGAFAEYVCAPANRLVRKPPELTFEQAAALGDSALTAIQALRDVGDVRPGYRVLINGASGGVGTFAVQIAKALGAHVTAVCSTRHAETVLHIGADQVVDYTSDDFVAHGSRNRFDVLLDLVGNRTLAECKRVLAPHGALVSCTGSQGRDLLGPIRWLVGVWAVDKWSKQKLRCFLVRINSDDLRTLAEMARSGKITPIIEQVHRLDDAPEAMRHVESGHAQGKTVLRC